VCVGLPDSDSRPERTVQASGVIALKTASLNVRVYVFAEVGNDRENLEEA